MSGFEPRRSIDLAARAQVVRSRLVWVALAFGTLLSRAAADPILVMPGTQSPQGVFEVRGLAASTLAKARKLDRDDPHWKQILSVYVGKQASALQPAMLGTFAIHGDAIRFTPRFPLERGETYRAVFDTGKLEDTTVHSVRLVKTFAIPVARAGKAAHVVAIYPSSSELPENLLRVYLHFSVPMSQGDSYQYVHLWDATQKKSVDGAFLEVPQELWDTSGTRLTLLLDPGRVKQGLLPREEAGPVLIADHDYTLTIDRKWPDAEGRPLQATLRKQFRAGKPDTLQPDPQRWKVDAPTAGSSDRLTIRFPEALDHAMLEHVLRVVRLVGNSHREEIPGTIQIAEEERCWCFTPVSVWKSGQFAVAVSTSLEDRSGNSIAHAFEVDLSRSKQAKRTNVQSVLDVRFDVKPPRP